MSDKGQTLTRIWQEFLTPECQPLPDEQDARCDADSLNKAEQDLIREAERTGSLWSYTFTEHEFPTVFEQLHRFGNTTVHVPTPWQHPDSPKYTNIRYQFARVHLLPPVSCDLDYAGDCLREVKLTAPALSTFMNRDGRKFTFTHEAPRETHAYNQPWAAALVDSLFCRRRGVPTEARRTLAMRSPFGKWKV